MTARNGLQTTLASAHDPRHEREWTAWGRAIAADDLERRNALAHIGRQRKHYAGSMSPEERRQSMNAWQREHNTRAQRRAKGTL